MRVEPIGCPETSVRNYHYSLCNNVEEQSSHLLRGGRLKSCMFQNVHKNFKAKFRKQFYIPYVNVKADREILKKIRAKENV
jgi:hypothetical protein